MSADVVGVLRVSADLAMVDETARDRYWARAQQAADTLEHLLPFARDVLENWPDGGVDGFDLQDLAIKHGLLVPEQRAAPCSDDEGACRCAEYFSAEEWGEGITCYRRAEWLR